MLALYSKSTKYSLLIKVGFQSIQGIILKQKRHHLSSSESTKQNHLQFIKWEASEWVSQSREDTVVEGRDSARQEGRQGWENKVQEQAKLVNCSSSTTIMADKLLASTSIFPHSTSSSVQMSEYILGDIDIVSTL